MNWLNYHHLLYFYVVAREGGVTAASHHLGVSAATISSQVKQLERRLKEALFEREGRRLVLTDRGKLAFSYAESIFSLGREMQAALRSQGADRLLRLVVGITDVVPKLVAHRLLEPVLALPQDVRLTCKEGKAEDLLTELATNDLDIIITDSPIRRDGHHPSFNHLLGKCGITFFGAAPLATKYRRRFPESLDGAPLLLPTLGTTLRHALDHWFAAQGIEPRIAGEFEDSALLKVFGQSGVGLFAGPQAIEEDIVRHYGVTIIGRVDEVLERFYAVALERRLTHPAVKAVAKAAKARLFT